MFSRNAVDALGELYYFQLAGADLGIDGGTADAEEGGGFGDGKILFPCVGLCGHICKFYKYNSSEA